MPSQAPLSHSLPLSDYYAIALNTAWRDNPELEALEAGHRFFRSVILLNSGGTINTSGDTERKPTRAVDACITVLNGVLKKHHHSGLLPSPPLFERPPDSSNIGEAEWDLLFSRVLEILSLKQDIGLALARKGQRPQPGGMIITHGTDTLALTSLVLSLRLARRVLEVPIIFTGSHSPMSKIDDKGQLVIEQTSEGFQNLVKSAVAASHDVARGRALPPGVYAVIGKDIHLATRLSKVFTKPSEQDKKYFFSFPAPIGQITGEALEIKLDQAFLETLGPKTWPVELIEERPFGIVEHIALDKDSSPSLLAELSERMRFYQTSPSLKERRLGLILQGNFARSEKLPAFEARLKHLMEQQNVLLAVGSREVYQAISPALMQGVALIHRSLSYDKARAKLSWLLRTPLPNEAVLRLLDTNFAGEVLELSTLPEWINYETLPPSLPERAVVICYPGMHERVVADAVTRILAASRQSGKRPELHLYGFGDGHVPTVNEPIASIVRRFVANDPFLRPLEAYVPQENEGDGSLKELVDALGRGLRTFSREEVLRYLKGTYVTHPRIVRSEVHRRVADSIGAQFTLKLKNSLVEATAAVGEEEAEEGTLHQKTWTEALEEALKRVTFHPRPEALERKLFKLYGSSSFSEVLDSPMSFIASFGLDLLARRIIKEAVMARLPLLSELGRAVDQGAGVQMHSLAMRAQTDISRYEPGNMLLVLGVKSDQEDKKPGWEARFLRRASDLEGSWGNAS